MFTLRLRQQRLQIDEAGYRNWLSDEREALFVETETAVVLCDVWDRHWCRGAVERLEAMLDRMAAVVAAARDAGALIVHAPSDTMAFYAGTRARERAPPRFVRSLALPAGGVATSFLGA